MAWQSEGTIYGGLLVMLARDGTKRKAKIQNLSRALRLRMTLQRVKQPLLGAGLRSLLPKVLSYGVLPYLTLRSTENLQVRIWAGSRLASAFPQLH